MEHGWNWWFDGTEPPVQDGWSEVDTPGGGNYWSEYDFFEYFYEDWALDSSSGQWDQGTALMSTIDSYLHSGYGTSIAAYSGDNGHALSVWGYEYDDAGNYTGIYVTDSDDYATDLKLLSVDLIDGLWHLDSNNDYGYQDWFIGGVQALDQYNPIPEPGTFLLLSLGLLSLLARLRRKQ